MAISGLSGHRPTDRAQVEKHSPRCSQYKIVSMDSSFSFCAGADDTFTFVSEDVGS